MPFSTRFAAFMIVAVVSVGAACGGNVVLDSGGSGGGAGCGDAIACDITQMNGVASIHACSQLTGVPAAETPMLTASCTAGGGKIVSCCPTTGALGSCKLNAITMGVTATGEALIFYSGGAFTAALAEMACTSSGGTWTPAGG